MSSTYKYVEICPGIGHISTYFQVLDELPIWAMLDEMRVE